MTPRAELHTFSAPHAIVRETSLVCDVLRCCAGACTGVFASEEDDFDDALASLDVEELVAASQRGTQSHGSPPTGRSGVTPSPTLCNNAMYAIHEDPHTAAQSYIGGLEILQAEFWHWVAES